MDLVFSLKMWLDMFKILGHDKRKEAFVRSLACHRKRSGSSSKTCLSLPDADWA